MIKEEFGRRLLFCGKGVRCYWFELWWRFASLIPNWMSSVEKNVAKCCQTILVEKKMAKRSLTRSEGTRFWKISAVNTRFVTFWYRGSACDHLTILSRLLRIEVCVIQLFLSTHPLHRHHCCLDPRTRWPPRLLTWNLSTLLPLSGPYPSATSDEKKFSSTDSELVTQLSPTLIPSPEFIRALLPALTTIWKT